LVLSRIHRRKYAFGEDITCAVIHGVAALAAFGGLIVLVVAAAWWGTAAHVVSFAVFGTVLVIEYVASTLYHALSASRIKRVFQAIDHAGIPLLIAATYTPFLVVCLGGAWGRSLLAVVWAAAAAGAGLEFVHTAGSRKASFVLYAVMGGLWLLPLRRALETVNPTSAILLAVGGLLYLLGAVFYGWRILPHSHSLWHVLAAGGSTCHYFAVLYCL